MKTCGLVLAFMFLAVSTGGYVSAVPDYDVRK